MKQRSKNMNIVKYYNEKHKDVYDKKNGKRDRSESIYDHYGIQ